ncbi:MAG: hypothetical protein AVDCRST_MAG26-3905, partial [uncultured Chloroflexia bacterium]
TSPLSPTTMHGRRTWRNRPAR